MRELVAQMGRAHEAVTEQLADPASTILDIDRRVTSALRDADFPIQQFGHPLAGSLLPWIDKDLGNGQSREEWKAMAEANNILGRQDTPMPVDGLCIRIGAMRCHSQALTMKLSSALPVPSDASVPRKRLSSPSPRVQLGP